MLIHQAFRPDIMYHTNESGSWHSYDAEYCLNMKRYIKHQILEKFSDIQGKNFIIHWPSGMLQKTVPLISAIWELGGVVVVHDLKFNLQYHPLYQDFYSSIDYILVETGSLKFTDVYKRYGASGRKLYEIDYWDGNPLFGNLPNGPVPAKENSPALMVTSSGSLTAPKQIYWTHRVILNSMIATQATHGYQENDHVLHARALHHGSQAAWFFLATQTACKNHYYELNTSPTTSHLDHLISLLSNTEMQFTRVLLGTSLDSEFLNKLKAIPRDLALSIQSTDSIKTIEIMDQLFDTDKIQDLTIEFGCSEAPTPYMLQQISKDSWPEARANWASNIFETLSTDFYQIELFDEGLGFKSNDMQDFYIPGDDFKQLDQRRWQWLGRKTQIKRNGQLVYPQAIQESLSKQYPQYRPYVVADYAYKKIYTFLKVDTTEVDLLEKFNLFLAEDLDPYHQTDLVMSIDIKIPNEKLQLEPTDVVLRFLARKQLNLDTEV
jgi:hypothetical protein